MSVGMVMTADTVGAAARHDPQLRVPIRPRLRRGLTIRREGDEMIVYGGPKRQRFQGRSATTLLPSLIDALDGLRGHDQLGEMVGASEDIIFKSLSLLWTCGVIEEGDAADPAVRIDEELADFLSRMGDSTGVNRSWEEAADRLANARVEIVGRADIAEALIAELAPAMTCVITTGTPSAEATLVVLIGDGHRDIAEHCWNNGVRLVRLRLSGRSVDLGPLVDAQLTPCLECLSAEDLDDARIRRFGDRQLAVALFARELFALVTRTTPSPLGSRWRRVDLETLTPADRSAPSRVGCSNCSAAPGPVSLTPPLPVRYEASVAMPAKEFADLKAHQMHYKPSNLALQRKSRSWPVADRVALPPVELDMLDRPWATTQPSPLAITPKSLGLLLLTVAGLRGDNDGTKVQRWTASGGNIGSCTAYVVVRNCPDIPPGLYGYVSADHELARLAAEPAAWAGEAPITVVLTGDYRKVAEKYAAFALRIVFLDAGCAVATARTVATAIGLPVTLVDSWDDNAVGTALNLDLDIEPVTAVMTVGGTR